MMNYSKDREDFWKNIDEDYYKRNSKTGRSTRNLIVDYIGRHNIKSVLELGCNSGGNLLLIHKKYPDISLTGIDICDKAIKYGIEIEKNPANLLVGSLYDLSRFGDSEFDLVFTRGVLMHINHDAVVGIIKEAIRIAKKYIVHIEWHGEDKIRSYSNGVPHAFSHNFNKPYKQNGKRAKIKKVDLLGATPGGGANHFVEVSK